MDVGLATCTSPLPSSSSSEEESEVGEEGALDDSVCPAGCDPALFSLACQLREKRMDVEESLVEEKRAAEQSRKELETAKKKLKTVDAHVKTAQSELQVNQCSPRHPPTITPLMLSSSLPPLMFSSTLPSPLSSLRHFS